MSNTHNRDLVGSCLKNHSEVSDAKAEVPIPFPGKGFDITLTGFSIASQPTKDSYRSLPVNPAQLRAC